MITGVFNSRLDTRSVFRSYPKKNIKIKGWFNTKITRRREGAKARRREGAKARRREGAKARSDYYWTPSYQILMVGFKNTLPAPDIDLIFAR